MKKKTTTIILIAVLLIGLGLMLYPSAAHYWNSVVASHVVESYNDTVADMSQADYSAIFDRAEDYNRRLAALKAPLAQYESLTGYRDTLTVDDSALMGVICIDKINVELPIYHGTSNAVLSDGVGHIEGTSLPIGGEGRHTVLSSHRGLPSSRLFTDLDRLETGDIFTVTVLDRTLTYMVEDIIVTLPEETQYLQPEEGKDLCTLVTCTPYGVNTHRLLVRGKRIDNIKDNTVRVVNEASVVDKSFVALVIGVPILLLLLIITAIFDARSRRKG